MLDRKKFYIDGKWVDPNKDNDFDVINPSNEECFAKISLGSKEDVDKAVIAAKNAFESWRDVPKDKKIGVGSSSHLSR